MAEPLAVVGVVASIVQLVDFGSRVLRRLDEFQSSLGEIPESFRHIKAELPVLLDTLQQTKEAIYAGSVRDKTTKALLPAILGCKEQIESLDNILTKMLPATTDSRLRRSTKAIWSLHQDAKVERITKILRSYIGTLTFYHAYSAASSALLSLTGNTLPKRYYYITARCLSQTQSSPKSVNGCLRQIHPRTTKKHLNNVKQTLVSGFSKATNMPSGR
jgi:hypothetical protein